MGAKNMIVKIGSVACWFETFCLKSYAPQNGWQALKISGSNYFQKFYCLFPRFHIHLGGTIPLGSPLAV